MKATAGLAILLILIAGYVDAVAYLHFERIFVSFMSGNSTTLGIDLVTGQGGRAHLLGAALAGFVAGAFLGTLLGELTAGFRAACVPALVAVLLLAALWLDRQVPQVPSAALIALLALSMGVQNATIGQVGGLNVSLTYVTGMLSRVGKALAEIVLGRGGTFEWLLFVMMCAALVAGACGGAASYGIWQLDALAGPVAALAGLSLVSAVVSALAMRRKAPNRSGKGRERG